MGLLQAVFQVLVLRIVGQEGQKDTCRLLSEPLTEVDLAEGGCDQGAFLFFLSLPLPCLLLSNLLSLPGGHPRSVDLEDGALQIQVVRGSLGIFP